MTVLVEVKEDVEVRVLKNKSEHKELMRKAKSQAQAKTHVIADVFITRERSVCVLYLLFLCTFPG